MSDEAILKAYQKLIDYYAAEVTEKQSLIQVVRSLVSEHYPHLLHELVIPTVSNNVNHNSDRWENEGGLVPAYKITNEGDLVPADDSNLDLEDNVKSAVKKRKNVIKIREIDMTDDDWYHGC